MNKPQNQTPERKPYDHGIDDKRNLVAWVENQFPQLTEFRTGRLQTYPEFEQRFSEIHQAVMVFLGRIPKTYLPTDNFYQYYQKDMQRLPADFENKDTRKYAEHLDDLMFGIKEE